jgi:hypothetical protein
VAPTFGLRSSFLYNSPVVRRRLPICLTAALLLPGCVRNRDVNADLRITDVRTGWYDAGIEGGLNKLVPSVTLRLENVSQEEISRVELWALFYRGDNPDSWGEHYVRAIDRHGLAPGRRAQELVLRSPRGYTGSESRLKMLENKAFVDARVVIRGKHGSLTWVKMAEFPIERQLLVD